MFSIKTNIQQFGTFAAFAEDYGLGEGDLVITQSFIYGPYIKPLAPPCRFVMQEQYGAGEPSDEMIQHMMDDLGGLQYRRVVAVGGGTVIDIAKIFALGLQKNGTGSEVTNISIAELKQRHTKLGLADNAIFRGIQDHGGDYRLQHLEPMLRASNYAGIILGLYAKKNPSGNIADLNALYATLLGGTSNPDELYARLDDVLSCMVAKRPLHEYGMKAEECETFADSVLASQQRLLANNYAPLNREEIVAVYKTLF